MTVLDNLLYAGAAAIWEKVRCYGDEPTAPWEHLQKSRTVEFYRPNIADEC